ncbi:MAG: hypothetical protein U5N27_05800 [Rhizobium sp.]|nr:hypothetical protein [Rhizobium sp.]
MTMVCCDTPISMPISRPVTRTIPRLNATTERASIAAAGTLDERASHAADRLATAIRRPLPAHSPITAAGAWNAAALEALPFDLRKDLGWPSGDTIR